MMSQSLNNGTRRSTRDKKKPDHYGSFADPPKARKKSQKSNPTAANEDDVVDVKSASSSIKSSVRKMEIECKKDRALQDIGDQHRQARKDHAEAEIQVTSLNKEMESLKVQVQELQQDSSAVDRDVKISELQKQQLDTNSKIRAAEKEVALKKLDLDIATEAHESMKQIIIKGAVYEKRKADLEEEDSERKRSIEDLALIDKEKATKKWAANVDAVFYSENSTSESEEELSDDDTPPYQPHRSTTMKPQSTSQKILARQIRGRDLPPFSRGQEWPAFILAFESSTTNCQFTEGENLIRLQRSLKGEALELVQCLLVDPRGVRIAIDKLRKRFGRPGIIIKTMMQKLQQIPNVKTDNYESWVKLGTGVDNLVSTIKSLGAKQQLSNPSLVDELVKKLPAQKAMEWEEFKLRKKLEFPSLSHLAKWLQPTVEAAYALCPLPGTSTEKLSTDKPNHDNRRPPANQRGVRKNDRVMVTTEKNEARQAQSNQRGTERKCHFCNGSHGQRHCPKFKEADVNMRWAMVKEKRCCIGCLNRGHRMHECRSKRVCGIEGCQQTHCQLLHNRNARNSEESSHITEQQRNQSSEQEVALSAVSGRSNSNINYNVIPIYAKRRDGQLLPMYMVLDGYASLTSADDSIRQQLNVDGRRRPLTVQGFQSTTTTPNSYEVDIEIVSRLDGKSYTLRNVRTVPKLDLPSQSLTKETLKRFSHIEGTPILTYQNVVPTILVGMDNFELHLPEEMKIGRVGEPAAIRTAMGWALVGPTASPPKKLHHAFHINDRQDDPLHQLVKQFFTTEYEDWKMQIYRSARDDRLSSVVIIPT
ncbi:Gag-Pol polyprotein [Folsomia candida]|uniref:Gag-Pol polyprotein n=1 Tax=Folsomia candida TaxID=158441 RepID=A0A226E274_FOLCA|nr:Gag-Pol polyprotein [Folsomia candida]